MVLKIAADEAFAEIFRSRLSGWTKGESAASLARVVFSMGLLDGIRPVKMAKVDVSVGVWGDALRGAARAGAGRVGGMKAPARCAAGTGDRE